MSHESSREFANSPQTVDERIHELSALGWRARDISTVLQIHEQQVRQILEALPNRYATVSEPRRNPLGFEQAAEAHRRAWTR